MEISVDDKAVFAATGGRPFDPALPSLVFVHGAAMDHTIWALQTRYFAHHGRNVLALDLPGHGRSAGPVLEDIGALADWLMRVFDARGIESAQLAGHSMGSLVALEAAARHPERVTALALLGTSVPMPVTDALLAAAKADDHDAFDMVTLWGLSRDGQVGGNRAPGLWMTGGGLRLLERSGPGVMYADLAACNDYKDGIASARTIQCPTLLLLGERDAMTSPRAAKALAEAIAGSETVVLAGCGHMMMVEQPDQVLDALIAHL
jgi:pimeloyl-ACP methyl ester carboxylesterase